MEKWFITKIPTYYIMIDNEFDVCPEMLKWKTPRHLQQHSRIQPQNLKA
jgi:hypothetical protein